MDPTDQSEYKTSKAEITQKKTDISIQLCNADKEYEKLVHPDTSKYEKRHISTLSISLRQFRMSLILLALLQARLWPLS